MLSQLLALRYRNALLSLQFHYALTVSFAGVYLLNYILFKLLRGIILFSTLLLELSLVLGVFFFVLFRFIEKRKTEVEDTECDVRHG